ncbi:NAD(P)-dependent oxidoreductase [Desulfosarcina ovata subsp. sediminis]|uniref:dTDP-4-dehydrorhamnose reductase n=1 Tax=Desulfosarcina ovata subsp. sediminis TaxID=885957 RepID=A0A5K7ZHF8_9BACT|nr:dTDP-4-dehydrorhamnose reductase [Desulfosarcina ovata]BBO80291.1 NAD(P)-dependent oxidoreductase [Desulfosarcina ovata subsp. sediminis]
MNILIIGGNGQLGQTLSRTAPDHIDFKSLDLPEFDITNSENVATVVGKEKPDVIINASAYTAVDKAEEEPELAFAVNATGPGNLAVAAKNTGSRLIHISTDYVFDGTACTPYQPDAPCTPLGVYGRTKRQGEINVQEALDDYVIIRTSWLYSQYGNNFVLTMLRLMQEREELKVVCDQVGSPTWASTLAMAIWAVIEKPNLTGIYHWSDAGVASWYDFSSAIQEEAYRLGLLNKPIPISPIRSDAFPTPAKRPSYSVLDCMQSWHEFEANPMHWRTALKKMLSSISRR